MQTAGRLRFSLWGTEVRRLTFYQRISGLIYAVTCLFNIFLTMSLFSMPAVLISGGRMVAYATDDQLRWLIRSCWFAFAVNRISELALFLPSGYRTGQRGSRAILWMAPCKLYLLPFNGTFPRAISHQSAKDSGFAPTDALV